MTSQTSKPNLGHKHQCGGCQTRYYDLGKPGPVCPKCGKAAPKAAAEKQSVAELVSEDDSKAKLGPTLYDQLPAPYTELEDWN
jgi:uncharacterized protein (TIGR02300 family)